MVRYCGIVACLFFFGCSGIFEERTACPCLFVANTEEVGRNVGNIHVWFFNQDGTLLLKDTMYRAQFGGDYIIELSRDIVSYYMWANISSSEVEGGISPESALRIGEDALPDSLYLFENKADMRCESIRDTIRLRKEYAEIDLVFKGRSDLLGKEPLITIECGTNGRRIDGGYPEGTVSIHGVGIYVSDDEREYIFRIWRQSEIETMFLKIENSVVPFGKILHDRGYDMSARDLADIKMVIDLSSDSMTLDVGDWIVELPVEIEI